MDGVLIHEDVPIPGAADFIARIRERELGLNQIGAHSETSAMVGDRMDTDIVAALEAGMESILVLTGSTPRSRIETYPFRPSRVLESVAELIDEV